ncbi:MAG: aldo/keto reductase, partial [bacterium]|nr:aldo/keto reductase [bacterium]
YGAGHSEEVVGEAVSGGRDAWVIETKGGEGFTEDGVNWKDFSYARLLSQVDESLKRLQMEYVDVYLLHSPSNEDLEDGEALKALAEIKASGRARFVGVSLGSAAMGLDLIAQGVVDVLQVSLSIMDVRIAEELLPAAQKAGVGIVARGAMGAGFFTGKIDGSTPFEENDRRSWQSESSKASRAKVAEEFRFLEKTGRTLSQSYLKYVLSFEGISTVIPGSKTQAHMEENAGASEASELTEEEVTRVAGTRERLQAG